MKTYSMLETIKADVWRIHGRYTHYILLKTFLTDRTFRPILTLRLCQAAHKLTPILKTLSFPCAFLLHRQTQNGAGIDLPWKCSIGPGFSIQHGWGLVINGDAIIGSNVTVLHGVTIGGKRKGDGFVAPTIGNEVIIAAGAIIIGDVHIGDGAIVGAGAIVVKNIAAYSIVTNEPCKEIQTNIQPRSTNLAPLT
jgi:serine O-acetyltransferase